MGDDLSVSRVIGGFDTDNAVDQTRMVRADMFRQLVPSRAGADDQPLLRGIERNDYIAIERLIWLRPLAVNGSSLVVSLLLGQCRREVYDLGAVAIEEEEFGLAMVEPGDSVASLQSGLLEICSWAKGLRHHHAASCLRSRSSEFAPPSQSKVRRVPWYRPALPKWTQVQ